MGMFDTVYITNPADLPAVNTPKDFADLKAAKKNGMLEFQSKDGPCNLDEIYLREGRLTIRKEGEGDEVPYPHTGVLLFYFPKFIGMFKNGQLLGNLRYVADSDGSGY
jgi:hypothetical protein